MSEPKFPLLFSVSCNSDKIDELVPPTTPVEGDTEMLKFTKETEYGIYKGNITSFAFDKRTCQLGFNTTKRTFRLQTDTETTFFSVELDAEPVLDAEIKAKLRTSDDMDIVIGELTLKVVKTLEQKLWLWDNKTEQGLIIRLK